MEQACAALSILAVKADNNLKIAEAGGVEAILAGTKVQILAHLLVQKYKY